VLVVLAGIVFHHSGGVYDTIRVIYLALVIGFLVFAASARRRRGRNPSQGTAGGPWGGMSGGQSPFPGSSQQPGSPQTDPTSRFDDPPAPSAD
jgi:hypothetical protein